MILAGMAASCGTPPAVLPRVDAAPQPTEIPKSLERHEDGDVSYWLFVPPRLRPGPIHLRIHFHTAWHIALEQHRRAGLDGPLLVFSNGAGSSVYDKPFRDPQRLWRWIRQVEEAIPGDDRVASLSITSFSAGYGAVRLIVQDPKALGMLTSVVLADSLYGGLDEAVPVRWTDEEDVAPWLPLAREAIAGRKSFLMSVSEVPTPYASSSEVARTIAGRLGLTLSPVHSCAPAGRGFPLLARADAGKFHVWLFGGGDAAAHLAHVRNLGLLLDALGKVDERRSTQKRSQS